MFFVRIILLLKLLIFLYKCYNKGMAEILGNKMKIAVFGGTFDPVHIGHTEICRKLGAVYGFDKIIIMPCGDPPHKAAGTGGRFRFEMCKLAFQGAKYEVSDYELSAPGKSYTYRTLEHIGKEYGTKPYYIAGGDSMRDMHTWRCPERIAAASAVIIADRKSINGAAAAAAEFARKYRADIHISGIDVPDVSGTGIRILNSFGIGIEEYTGAAVAAYIKEKKLCLDYNAYACVLKTLMGEERLFHSAFTAVTAAKLAERYGVDKGKAVIAGLIHDCAKEVSESVLKAKYGIETPPYVAAMHPKIRHAPLGALLAGKLFGISDPEILNAVKYHTSGNPDMAPLEKLIFIADYIEPTRGYGDTAEKYDLAFKDIDKAVECKYAEIARKQGGAD